MARLKQAKEKGKRKPEAKPAPQEEEGGNGKAGFFGRLPELRPRAQVLAQQGLDDETIATLLKEPVERVQNYLANELKFGRAQLKARIMRAQIECAVEGHDAVMLKRLGEEYCGQGIITQQGSIASAGKQVFVLNVGVQPKNLDGPAPGPVRQLPARKQEEDALDAEYVDLPPDGED
jgi:hypothetical protein